MFSKYDEIRARRARGDKGFTLIELLVVVVIIGILIAIAIPVYLNYQKSAKNKAAEADTRNAVATVMQCFADGGSYPTIDATAGKADEKGLDVAITCGDTGSGNVVISPNNTLSITPVAADATAGTDASFTVVTIAGDPGDMTYTYDSTKGNIESAKSK